MLLCANNNVLKVKEVSTFGRFAHTTCVLI